jgi:hypothetical protein
MTKNTLKISYEEITKEKKEKEIPIPYYSKSYGLLNYIYKVSAEDKILQIYVGANGDFATITSCSQSNILRDAINGEMISKEEFDSSFTKVMEIINANNSHIQESGYTKEQEEEMLLEEEKKKFILEGNTERE